MREAAQRSDQLQGSVLVDVELGAEPSHIVAFGSFRETARVWDVQRGKWASCDGAQSSVEGTSYEASVPWSCLGGERSLAWRIAALIDHSQCGLRIGSPCTWSEDLVPDSELATLEIPSLPPPSITQACPEGQVESDGYSDTVGNTHEAAVDCIDWWEITGGVGDGLYAPGRDVTRGQMASFIARMILRSGGSLPDDPGTYFLDVDGGVHALAINQLAEVGVVAGREDGTYRPGSPVNRAQMASFLVRGYEYRASESLEASRQWFNDVAGVHAATINAAAEAGFTAGTDHRTYSPASNVTRGQMSSFIARTLNKLVEDDYANLPE